MESVVATLGVDGALSLPSAGLLAEFTPSGDPTDSLPVSSAALVGASKSTICPVPDTGVGVLALSDSSCFTSTFGASATFSSHLTLVASASSSFGLTSANCAPIAVGSSFIDSVLILATPTKLSIFLISVSDFVSFTSLLTVSFSAIAFPAALLSLSFSLLPGVSFLTLLSLLVLFV